MSDVKVSIDALVNTCRERDAALARCRAASQTIIDEIGADGPEDAEESARRAVAALRAAIAERDAMRERAITAEQERDALRVRVSELETLTDAPAVAVEMDRLLGLILDTQGEAVRAQQERDRLRREVEALRDTVARWAERNPWLDDIVVMLGDALAGGES